MNLLSMMRSLQLCAFLVVGVVVSTMGNSEEDEVSPTNCPCGWSNKGRIVGGMEAKKNAYPLIVSIRTTGNQHFCGGTIITPWHVITAAHCLYNIEDPRWIVLNVGSHTIDGRGEGVYAVDKMITHENFIQPLLINDIALLVTKQQITFSSNVGPACLPTSRVNLEGETIKALGWGLTTYRGRTSDLLQEVDLHVIGHDECYQTWENNTKSPQADTNMCTYEVKKDTCQGDSGGPLIRLDPDTYRYTLVALVSYGGACGGHQAAPNTDVAAFLPWIYSQIAATHPEAQTCHKVKY